MSTPPADSRTAARARELLVLASMMATILWGITLFDATSGGGHGRLSGQTLGSDFVAFYTYAVAGHSGRLVLLESPDAFFAEQVRLVPTSVNARHPPLYPPQVALALAPLGRVTYSSAYALWILWSAFAYGAVVFTLVARTDRLARWPRQAAVLAVASPAFWMLIVHGQLSAMALAALWLMWRGLVAGRGWLAGVGVGLLAFKPVLFAPALAVCVLAGQWTVASAALLTAVAQYAAAVPWAGWPAVEAYGQFLWRLAWSPDAVAGNPRLMHSLRTFWTVLPAPLAGIAYVVSAGAVVVAASVWWRRARSPLEVVAVVAGAVVLASPHLYVYDLVLLTPLVVASIDRRLAGAADRVLTTLTGAGYLAPLWGPPLAVAGLQATTIVLAAWFVVFGRSLGQEHGRSPSR